ncbi:type VI secretion system baseplate subunit TssG [Ochrobactrum sp. GPK 3]|uniref:type VI secretion system baseplate subunit TssG n=1 Tax=Brucella sp. 22210 TaxID=3453892 RepID=UPI00313854C0
MIAGPSRLLKLLRRDPGRFEPITALRVAQHSSTSLTIRSPNNLSIQVLPVEIKANEGEEVTLNSTLATLFGPTGSLPPLFNELAIEQPRKSSLAFNAFIDLFNDRLAVLFADACEKYRIASSLRWRTSSNNAFEKTLLSLAGFGTKNPFTREKLYQSILMRYSGYFSNSIRSSANLNAILTDFTNLPVTVEQFRLQLLEIPICELTSLGKTNCRLGIDAIAGKHIHDYSSGFRIIIGPVKYKEFVSLLPSGSRLKLLDMITRLYVGGNHNFDFQLTLKKEEIPHIQLGDKSILLGWNSWLRATFAVKDSGDAIFVTEP